MITEPISRNQDDTPTPQKLTNELKAIRIAGVESEKVTELHASDNHIDYIAVQAKAWRDQQLAKGITPDMGAYLQLFSESDTRKPFDIASIKDSQHTIRERVRKNMPRWQLSDAKRGIQGRPEQAKDMLVDLVRRAEVLRSNHDVQEESVDAFIEFLSNSMSLGKKHNSSQPSPYYGRLYVLNPNFYSKYDTSLGREQFDNNKTKTRDFLRKKAQEKKMILNVADFTHFNTAETSEVTDRIYIALDPFGEPTEGLRAWWQALEDAGLQDSLYFKVFGGVSDRLDSIVVYPTKNVDPVKLTYALEVFQKIVPKNAILDHATNTGIELARGISYGTEVDSLMMIHKLLDAANERTSFGILLGELSATAMQLGYKKVAEREKSRGSIKISLSEVTSEAKQYLRELLVCAEINPDTMVPWSRGGQLPQWAADVRRESASVL